MKRLIALMAAVLCFGFSFSCPAFAEESGENLYTENIWNFVDVSMDISGGIPEDAGGVLDRIRTRGKLIVATNAEWPPQEFLDPDKSGQDQFAGADMELARRIAQRMGVELEIRDMSFSDVLSAAADDSCDLVISALAFIPSRAVQVEMSKGYYFTDSTASTGIIIREADREAILSLNDLSGKILAAQSGSLQESLGADNVKNYREFRRLQQVEEVYHQVETSLADAGFVDMETAEEYIQSNPGCGLTLVEGLHFTLEEHQKGDRIAAKKGETALIAFVNGVIDEVTESGEFMNWIHEAEERARELNLREE